MDPILQQIDKNLTNVEEQFLIELTHIRKEGGDDIYCELNEGLMNRIRTTLQQLIRDLDNSGDSSNLSLKTVEHEKLQDRMTVLSNLTSQTIPSAFVRLSHDEAKAERQQVEFKVARFRADNSTKGMAAELYAELTAYEKTINPDRVSEQEESQFAMTQDILDRGLYSASRELAILKQQVLLHHKEGQSIEEVIQGRAEFNSRDLSQGHAQDEKSKPSLAQSPDEIRRKLAERGESASTGASTFVAKDLSASNPTPAPTPQKSSRRRSGIAQTPEEIRRKLEEQQQAQGSSSGKASFGAKDIEPVQANTPPAPKEDKAPPPPPQGKAVFGAKDIESLNETVSKQPTERSKEKEPAKEPGSGKAVFESKDLSNPKP